MPTIAGFLVLFLVLVFGLGIKVCILYCFYTMEGITSNKKILEDYYYYYYGCSYKKRSGNKFSVIKPTYKYFLGLLLKEFSIISYNSAFLFFRNMM